ncbi:hypothetical protein NEOLEDRAFT_1038907, partial [Neolentinus lepideus HHB14362 ss-1]
VRIQIISDLRMGESNHTFDLDVTAHADYLALLGDTARVADEHLFPWLEDVLGRFKLVFYVTGNHEPYGTTVDSAIVALEARPRTSKLVIRIPRYDVSDTFTVLGCTLWSDLRQSPP